MNWHHIRRTQWSILVGLFVLGLSATGCGSAIAHAPENSGASGNSEGSSSCLGGGVYTPAVVAKSGYPLSRTEKQTVLLQVMSVVNDCASISFGISGALESVRIDLSSGLKSSQLSDQVRKIELVLSEDLYIHGFQRLR
jgi:hypothetical protein